MTTSNRFRVLLCVVATAWLCAASAAAQPPVDDDPALARIRESLDRPPALTIAPPKADFHIEIHDYERERWMKIFDTPLWVLDPEQRPRQWQPPSPFGSQTLASVDLLAIGSAVAHAISERRHERAERDAAQEVREAIAAYCAAQPDAGRSIEICAKQ